MTSNNPYPPTSSKGRPATTTANPGASISGVAPQPSYQTTTNQTQQQQQQQQQRERGGSLGGGSNIAPPMIPGGIASSSTSQAITSQQQATAASTTTAANAAAAPAKKLGTLGRIATNTGLAQIPDPVAPGGAGWRGRDAKTGSAAAASASVTNMTLSGLMPGRHGTPGLPPGTVFDQPMYLRAGTATYVIERIVGNGSFGVVLQARTEGTSEVVAIKRVLQDKRYKNRELQMMKMFKHPNVVELKNSFYSSGTKDDEVFLHLVMEFLPETIYKTSRDFIKRKQQMPLILIKLFMFQLCRALGYMHSLGACHRDIKPQNLLVDANEGHLKLCDFGSAKVLQRGEANVSYICSRYYRAPELIFGANNYTPAIDVWSMGCVMAELFLGQPLFPGDSGVDQLVEIIKVLGTPTHEQVLTMNKDYPSYNFPDIKAHPWPKVFSKYNTPADAIDLLSRVLVYTPSRRPHAIELLVHPFFDELRDPTARLPNNGPLPRTLFDFTTEELSSAAQYGVRERLEQMMSAAHANRTGGGVSGAGGNVGTQLPHLTPRDPMQL